MPEELDQSSDPFSMDRETRTFVLMVAGASVPVFMLGFNLGAFGTIFFNHYFAVWAVATTTLIASIVLRARWKPPLWGLAVLALPSVWMLADFFSGDDATSAGLFDAIYLISLLALPYLVYVVAKLISPDYFQLKGLRLRGGVVVIVLAVFGAGVFVGAQNQRFLTCEDFRLSGNDLPPNCASGEPKTQLWEPSP
jgi:hypothetical protein